MTKRILLASHNRHKKEEFEQILKDYDIEIVTPEDKDEPNEDGRSFKENSYIKAKYYYDKYGIATIADDSGLSISYFNNLPDIHSARFLSHLEYSEKNALICKMMKDIKNRYAYYTCVITLIDNGEVHYFEGIMKGNIADKPKGENGFGYDPIFIPETYDITCAEMTSEKKNAISHRAKALKGLIEYFEKQSY